MIKRLIDYFSQESSTPDSKQQQISKAEATTKMKRISEPSIALETAPFPRVAADHKTR